MIQFTYPGVYVVEESSGVRTISGVATSIAVFVGWAPQGPTDEARRITSFAEFTRIFGPLQGSERVYLGHAVYQFFANGGQDAYVWRIASSKDKVATLSAGGLKFAATGPGEWANRYGVVIKTRKDGTETRFTVEVRRITKIDGKETSAIAEVFNNLSANPDDPRYVGTIIEQTSDVLNVVEVGTNVQDVPNVAKLQGGTTGAPLNPDDKEFVAAVRANHKDQLDDVDLFNLLCIPGAADEAMLGELLTYCVARRAMLIADGPQDEDNPDKVKCPDQLTGDSGRNGVFFYPWLRASDPVKEGRLRDFPPSGFIAGVIARTDANRGVWKTPAGTEASLNGASAPKFKLDDQRNGILNVRGVNCIRSLPIYGTVSWGGRTNHGQDERGSEWKYVAVRRMALYLEESLYRGLKWVVFEPNDEPLWAQIRLNVGAFMHDLFRQHAFQGLSPGEAYYVKCDKSVNPQNDINRGIVNIHVGFAPLKPAEFVVLHIQQITGEIQT